MTPLEMIAEWRRGCSVAIKDMGHQPEECHECTRNLIEAMERQLIAEAREKDPTTVIAVEKIGPDHYRITLADGQSFRIISQEPPQIGKPAPFA